ncbi:MAG: hypothetical protein MHPSP_002857, partial [Paramarteilia canceri]
MFNMYVNILARMKKPLLEVTNLLVAYKNSEFLTEETLIKLYDIFMNDLLSKFSKSGSENFIKEFFFPIGLHHGFFQFTFNSIVDDNCVVTDQCPYLWQYLELGLMSKNALSLGHVDYGCNVYRVLKVLFALSYKSKSEGNINLYIKSLQIYCKIAALRNLTNRSITAAWEIGKLFTTYLNDAEKFENNLLFAKFWLSYCLKNWQEDSDEICSINVYHSNFYALDFRKNNIKISRKRVEELYVLVKNAVNLLKKNSYSSNTIPDFINEPKLLIQGLLDNFCLKDALKVSLTIKISPKPIFDAMIKFYSEVLAKNMSNSDEIFSFLLLNGFENNQEDLLELDSNNILDLIISFYSEAEKSIATPHNLLFDIYDIFSSYTRLRIPKHFTDLLK